MKLRKARLVLLFALFSMSAFGQWTQGKGNGYFKLGSWYINADEHYTDTGAKAPNATRSTFNIHLYGEYGIIDKLDAILYAPLYVKTSQNAQVSGTTGDLLLQGDEVSSIGDVDIGLRYQLLKKEHAVLSSTLKFGLPLGKDEGGFDGSYQTGDGEFNQLLQFDFAVPFVIQSASVFLKTYFGLNNRTENFSDELHYGLEGGLGLFKNKFWLFPRLNRVQSLQNGSKSFSNSQGSIFANNIEYTNLGVEAAFYITPKIGVSAGFATAIDGRIVYAAPAYFGGIFLDLK